MGDYSLRDLVRVPGLLSLARIPLAVAFPFVVRSPPVALGVLCVAAGTDMLDGWYARHFHEETPTGRILDPITDKIFVLAVAAALVASDLLSVGEAILLGTREICELALVAYGIVAWHARARPERAANRMGKAATAMQFSTVAAVLFGVPHRGVWIVATAACGVLSGIVYAAREWRAMSGLRGK